jgi:iron(III) dicitrate ABC transporter, ATP-binding protein FecE
VLMGRTPYKGITEGDSAEDVEIARRAMRETGVLSMERDSFARLSGGEQQRVMLARALTQETPCLILDEPTNHLDITYQLQIMDLIAARRLTVVAAVHDLNIAAMYCDRIVALQEGRIIAEGTPDEVLTPALIERLYRVRASVFARADGRPAVVYERGARG